MKRGNTHKVELSKKYFLLLRNFELAQKEYNRKYTNEQLYALVKIADVFVYEFELDDE